MRFKKILYLLSILTFIIPSALQAQRWEKVVSIPQPYLSNYWLDVYFLPSNPSYGWVCGFNGMVIRTTNGGNSWEGATISGANHLEGIHFPSENIGYTSGLDGLFKSTNGGASWFEVSPPSMTSTMWGCYFLDNNNGFVIGGGCLSNQEFWKTTDGGSTWSVFVGSLPNSGLTDLIVYSMFGTGYASSSGWIWETTDGGNTWAPMSNTGPNDWQEEITKVGNSFLVPTSSGCQGGSGGGGMRFTTDMGASWNRYNTGVRMFGSFLLSSQTGWVSGDFRNVWYTTDGGQNWILRNCGFDNGNLDDIWFITSNNGWIVGEGVYRLATPLQTVDKNSINFNEICIPGDSIDFVLLNNLNFNSDVVNVSILNDPNNEFSIVSPGTSFGINSCETTRLNIKFSPKTIGAKTAILRIDFGYGTNLNVNLAGYGVTKTIAPQDTLLKINPAYCGNDNVYGIRWTAATDRESIVDIVRIDGDNRIENRTNFPLKIPTGGVQSIFSANPIDTGWTSARFRCDVNPCPADTFVTVLAYGVSPIITAKPSSTFTLKCMQLGFDTIPVFNTGNIDLVITDNKILEPNTNFSIVGWANGAKLPVAIPPGGSKSIIVSFKKDTSKSNRATLQLNNNDMTFVRGDKNPFEILLCGETKSTNLISRDTTIDFGKVCIGASETNNFYILNFGDVEITLDQPLISASQYQISFNTTNYPIVLQPGDSVRCNVSFKPDKIGTINDTIFINSQPCNDIIRVAVTGFGIRIALDTDPQSFSTSFQTNTPFKKKFRVRSIGTEDLTITSIELGPPVSSIQIAAVDPPLSQNITYNGSMDFDVTFICSKDTVYDIGYLCFIATGYCPASKCIPIYIQSYSSMVEFSKDSVNYGVHYCKEGYELDTIWVINPGSGTDTIMQLDINPASSLFTILNKPPLPYTIDRNDSIPIYVEYSATVEGQHSATISLTTTTAKNISKKLYITGEFYKADTRTSSSIADFGSLEQCDSQKDIRIKFSNSGTLRDSITITTVNGSGLFTLNPNNYIIVPPLDSVELSVTVNPPDLAIGQHNAKFVFDSKVCPGFDTLDCKVNIYHHYLSYTPVEINFGEVWANLGAKRYIQVENKSAYEKNILFMQFTPDDINFSLDTALNYPVRFLPGGKLTLPVRFSAGVEGDYQSFLRIYEQSVCLDTFYINLLAKVPEEKYEATIQIGDYKAKPGQKITMTSTLSNPIPFLKPSGIKFRFTFDPYLFLPTAMFAQNSSNDRLTIPFSYRDGAIIGSIDSTFADVMMSKAGDVLWIQGTVFLANPDFTQIVIEQFEPITAKQVDLTKIDGSLKLVDACLPLAEFKLKYINKPTVLMTKNPVTDGFLNLSIKNTFETGQSDKEIVEQGSVFNIKIISIEGVEVFNKEVVSPKEKIDLIFDVSGYSSGLYYVVVNIGEYLLTEKMVIVN